MTTVSAPAWAPWTSYYDSAGQAPGMVTNVAGDGLSVQFMLDRLTLSLQGGQDAPFAGAAGLSGALSVNVPTDFSMLGFLLVVNGHLEKTAKSQAVVTHHRLHRHPDRVVIGSQPSRANRLTSPLATAHSVASSNPKLTPKSPAAAGTTPSSPGGGRDVISAST